MVYTGNTEQHSDQQTSRV